MDRLSYKQKETVKFHDNVQRNIFLIFVKETNPQINSNKLRKQSAEIIEIMNLN